MTRSMASTYWIVVSVGVVHQRVGSFGRREHAARALQMRLVEHLALVGHDAGPLGRGEGADDGLRGRDGCRRRLKSLVQHGDLLGMDRELAREAVAMGRERRAA